MVYVAATEVSCGVEVVRKTKRGEIYRRHSHLAETNNPIRVFEADQKQNRAGDMMVLQCTNVRISTMMLG